MYCRKNKMKTRFVIILLSSILVTHNLNAHGPKPVSLKSAPLPPVPEGLLEGPDPIIVDQEKAIILGKALFWDMAVGTDGIACASCHFHAGADSRIKNQLNPGEKNPAPSGQTFEKTASGAAGGPNYTLTLDDFPFHQRENPFFINSQVTFNTDDIAASSGSFSGEFNSSARRKQVNDDCTRDPHPIFNAHSTGTRLVEPRNAPTVINSVFYHRNFWDGRANNIFNGSSIWGNRDTEAGVWVKINGRTVKKQKLALINSSLASQALAPPLSEPEMACRNRTFMDIARKILYRRPLEHQRVHPEDSVLGTLSFSSENSLRHGLKTTYNRLIRQAFNKKYWSYRRRGPFGGRDGQRPYTQMEANFSMFFGLAIQMYEATLISDDSPFDNASFDQDMLPTNLGDSVRRGAQAFEELHCNVCHSGPALTANAVYTNTKMLEDNPNIFGLNTDESGSDGVAINRNIVNYDLAEGSRFFDTGFFNTGVQKPDEDPGVGGIDDFGNPLSFSSQYAEYLAGTQNAIVDDGVGIEKIKACNFQAFFASKSFVPPFITVNEYFRPEDGIIPDPNGNTGCYNSTDEAFIPGQAIAAAELSRPDSRKMAFATKAAFKVPTLRNIELTGPYMHNGSMATLEQVLEFYARGGNFRSEFTHEFIAQMGTIGASGEQKRKDIIAFLKSLTDERVRYEKAPFDHPELVVPHGHDLSEANILDASLATDNIIHLPPVGANGKQIPLKTFEEILLEQEN
jgi:cytochrome c peroxidase